MNMYLNAEAACGGSAHKGPRSLDLQGAIHSSTIVSFL